MILEGLVTTRDEDGTPHVAPMGPRLTSGFERFVLRPFKTSRTYRNLLAHPEGVLHVTDDVFLMASTAIGRLERLPALLPAQYVHGWILADSCRYYEFRIQTRVDSEERATMEAESVGKGVLRDFFGFNRAKHAVLEAAILATRVHLSTPATLRAEFQRLRILVDKTGGEQERLAFDLLQDYVCDQGASAAGSATS